MRINYESDLRAAHLIDGGYSVETYCNPIRVWIDINRGDVVPLRVILQRDRPCDGTSVIDTAVSLEAKMCFYADQLMVYFRLQFSGGPGLYDHRVEWGGSLLTS